MRKFLLPAAAVIACSLIQPASAKLLHRWSFDKDTADYVGGAHGKLRDGAAVRDGQVHFDGENNWMELPIGKTIEKLNSVTIETWFTWNEQQMNWTRIFDFGRNQSMNMFFTLRSANLGPNAVRGAPRFAITLNGNAGEQRLNANRLLEIRKPTHVAITVDAEKQIGKLYINGKEVATHEKMTLKPSDLGDTSENRVAISQYAEADPLFKGSITEFRIYDTALSAEDIEKSFTSGPDELGIKDDAARPAANAVSPAARPDDTKLGEKATGGK